MQKNIHKQFTDPTIPSKLKFILGTYKYIYMQDPKVYNCEIRVTDVCVVSEESARKMVSLLNGGDTFTPSKGEKMYVLPDCKIPGYKLKDYCRTQGISIVTDISKATCILGTENNIYMESDYDTDRYQLAQASWLSRGRCAPIVYSDYTVNFIKGRNTFYVKTSEIEEHDKIKEGDSILVSGGVLSEFSVSMFTEESIGDKEFMYLMPAESVELIFNILSRKLPVIKQEFFIETCAGQLPLDEQTYESLDMMLSSPSSDDHVTAGKKLFNINVSSSLYLYWKLVKKHSDKIMCSDNRRLKEYRLFEDMYKLRSYENYDEQQILDVLAKANQLTEDVYDKLISTCISETNVNIRRRYDDELQVLNIDPQPKYTYEEFMKIKNPNYVQVQKSEND